MAKLSNIHDVCKKCEHKDGCKNKRMVACAMAELPPLMEKPNMSPKAPLSMPMAREYIPITINMGEYGIVNTSLEELKEQLERDIWKRINPNCNFNKI